MIIKKRGKERRGKTARGRMNARLSSVAVCALSMSLMAGVTFAGLEHGDKIGRAHV